MLALSLVAMPANRVYYWPPSAHTHHIDDLHTACHGIAVEVLQSLATAAGGSAPMESHRLPCLHRRGELSPWQLSSQHLPQQDPKREDVNLQCPEPLMYWITEVCAGACEWEAIQRSLICKSKFTPYLFRDPLALKHLRCLQTNFISVQSESQDS